MRSKSASSTTGECDRAAGCFLLPLLLIGLEGAAVSSEIPKMLPQSGPPAGYTLVWSDDFDGSGLPDPAKWGYDTAYNRKGWHNKEQQYYGAARPTNSRVENGRLVIEAHKEALNPKLYRDWGGQTYTSARLVTRGRAEWMYGYFEVRARIPCAVGSWPAIWMLPTKGEEGWRNGEIDIMEHVGFQPGRVHHSVQTSAANFSRGNHPTAVSHLSTACQEFHNYQLLWTPERLLMGVDGSQSFTYLKRSERRSHWPFNRPFYLLLNVAVGGSWGGAHGIDDGTLPARMEIEYVRVYQQGLPK